MRHIGLFEGFGGFGLAAKWMGWETIAWCEWLEYNQQILKYYFPNATPHGNIIETDFTIYRGKCDILTGGFPCQPFSTAGEGLGSEDERFLFPEMLRAIREIQPEWIVAENVRGITSQKFAPIFEQICSSLEVEGYEVQPIIIPASAIGADHERYRVWFIAHSKRTRLQGQGALLGSMQPKAVKNWQASRFVNFIQRNSMPFVCSDHDGISRRLDEQALHGYGNAIHPGIAYEIFKTIECLNPKSKPK